MKSVLKIVAMMFLATSALAVKKERNHEEFYYLNSDKMTTQSSATTSEVVFAFDPASSEFVWKDFGPESQSNEWAAVQKDVLDSLLHDVKSVDDIKIIDEHIGTYYKIRSLSESINGEDVRSFGLDLGLRIRGGGPAAAVICGAVCKLIQSCGCGAGTIIISGLNPGLGVLYYGVCELLGTGGVASCVTACLAMPTP